MTETAENQWFEYGGFHPDHEELLRYFNENKVYTIQIESNLVCSQGCLFCYASSDDYQNRELPVDIIRNVLKSAVKLEVKAIDWLGGDPLMRKDWHELMIFAKDLGLINNIWTSGIPLADLTLAKKAVEVSAGGFISVHLDTLDEMRYKELHKAEPKKTIDTIIKGVNNISKLGKKSNEIYNCITFTKPLAGDDVRRTIGFFFNSKGVRTCLTQMCNVGSATDHSKWVPSIDEITDAIMVRDEINYPGSKISISTMDTNKFYCGGAICITIDGDVTPCSVIRKSYGNVYNQSLETIVEKNRDKLLYIDLRKQNKLPGNCMNCLNNSICWGCRAAAFYEMGDAMAIDPKCGICKN